MGDEKRQGPFPVGHHRGPRGLPTGARTSSCSLAQPPPPPTQGSGQLRLLKPGGSAGRDQGRWGPRHERGLCSLQHPPCRDPCHVSPLPEAPCRCGGLSQTSEALPQHCPNSPHLLFLVLVTLLRQWTPSPSSPFGSHPGRRPTLLTVGHILSSALTLLSSLPAPALFLSFSASTSWQDSPGCFRYHEAPPRATRGGLRASVRPSWVLPSDVTHGDPRAARGILPVTPSVVTGQGILTGVLRTPFYPLPNHA